MEDYEDFDDYEILDSSSEKERSNKAVDVGDIIRNQVEKLQLARENLGIQQVFKEREKTEADRQLQISRYEEAITGIENAMKATVPNSSSNENEDTNTIFDSLSYDQEAVYFACWLCQGEIIKIFKRKLEEYRNLIKELNNEQENYQEDSQEDI